MLDIHATCNTLTVTGMHTTIETSGVLKLTNEMSQCAVSCVLY